MAVVPALTERRWLRFGAFTAFYFAQGIPIGLLMVAVPGWLAEQVSMADLAVFTSVVFAPWGLKLVAGPFMDRFKFLPMGFRRPWVMAAQVSLIASLLAMATLGPLDVQSLGPFMVAGFVVNAFAATQDVAVDGMAIDILPEDERGRANAFMAFGQVAGSSTYGALCGTLLPLVDLPGTALVCAASVAVIFVVVAVVRERPGERTFPWTTGEPAPRAEATGEGILDIFRDLVRVLILPMSLVLVAVEFLNRVRDGIATAVFPKFAVDVVGLTGEDYSHYVGVLAIVSAVAGVILGPLIDRSGARRFLLIALVAGSLVHVGVGLLSGFWQDPWFVAAAALLVYIASQLIFISIIALFMNLCWTAVAATQFSVYMALANVSRTIGGMAFATVANRLSFGQDFLIMGGLLMAAAVLLLFFNERSHAERLDRLKTDRETASLPAT
ncbi:MAG: MFS transporter [Gammaproteobacteria bacterium]|nr:MFS transporter [Gammaproteobacteria bacterium]